MNIKYVFQGFKIVLGLAIIGMVSCGKGKDPAPDKSDNNTNVTELLTTGLWKVSKLQYMNKDSAWIDWTINQNDKESVARLTTNHFAISNNIVKNTQDTTYWELLNNDKELQFRDSDKTLLVWYDLVEITKKETIWRLHGSGTIYALDYSNGALVLFYGKQVTLSPYPQ